MDTGMGWGCPTSTEVTEGAGGVVTRKEPTGTGSFLHLRKLSRATLRMSWNGEAKPCSGRPVGALLWKVQACGMVVATAGRQGPLGG